jgi:outer membrane autotransporter protein
MRKEKADIFEQTARFFRRPPLPTSAALGAFILTSSSLAALMIGTDSAYACAVNQSGSAPSVGNASSIDCMVIESGASISGNVSNTTGGIITPSGTNAVSATGIRIAGGTVAGSIINHGSITAANGDGILVEFGGLVSGGISNAGTITATLGTSTVPAGYGILVTGIANFAGGISNSGTISSAVTGISVGLMTSFSGGISNSGTITGTNAYGIFAYNLATYTGGINNSGLIENVNSGGLSVNLVTSFSGGISNSGTISGSNNGIIVTNTTNFSDGITNSGTISGSNNGIIVTGTTNFSGGITNSGQISVGGSGISVATVGTFLGGISNSGTISSGFTNGINVSGVSSFAGGISNSGMIATTQNGIYVGSVSTFSGNISNSGTISAASGIVIDSGVTFAPNAAIVNSGTITGTISAIDASAATSPVIIDQIGGSISGAIKLSAFADTLNVSGGTIVGNIVGQGASNTLNFAMGSGTFTYGNAYGFSGIDQVNVNSGTVILDGANSATNVAVNSGILEVGDASNTAASLTATNGVNVYGTLAGHGTVIGNAAVESGGTLAVANALPAFATDPNGPFTIAGNLMSQGTVSVAAASGQAGNVLRVGGNYTGSNATLILNTVLNQGGAATLTDQLSIAGNASGNTAMLVHGTGSGAPTIGDGIEVVSVMGTSAANSFRLANPLQSGAYQYLLYQGGATSANSNWYLRSTFEAPQNGTLSAAPNPSSGAGTSAIAYRPGAVGYSMTPSLNANYGFTVLGTLYERVGDIASVETNPQNAGAAANKDGFWGRIGGEDLDANSSNGFAAQQNTFFAQFGKDWTLMRAPDGGSTHTGVTVTLGSSSASFDDNLRSLNPTLTTATGSLETQAQSIGGYWTRYLADGTYFDGVGQLTHYRNTYGDIYGDGAAQNGFSMGASAEVGKPFALGSTRIEIEPQAQLLCQYLHLNGFDDGVSPISSTASNGLRGRVGLRLFRKNLSNESGTASATPYLTVDVLHDFFSQGQTAVGSTPLESGLSKTWYEVGAGVTESVSKSSELYFTVKYARNIGDEYQRSVYGQVAYRYSW